MQCMYGDLIRPRSLQGGRMTMGWQKLSAFVGNCWVEHCMRKGSGKCRATGHVFQKVPLCDTDITDRLSVHFMNLRARAPRC